MLEKPEKEVAQMDEVQFEGQVEDVIFQNQENGYAVFMTEGCFPSGDMIPDTGCARIMNTFCGAVLCGERFRSGFRWW